MKKRIIASLLVAGLVMTSLVGCGESSNNTPNTSTETTENSVQTESTENTEVESTEQVVETIEPSESLPDETLEPETNDVTEENNAIVNNAANKIKEHMGEEYYANMPIDAETLELVYGLTPDMYDAYMGEMPMMSTSIETLLVVKPSEGMTETVVEKLSAYREYLINDSMQYPMNAVKLQATKVLEHNGLVYYLSLFGNAPELEENENILLGYCIEKTDEIVNVITSE